MVLAFDGDQKAALQTLFGSEEPTVFTDVQVAALPDLDPFLERTRAEIPEGRIDNFYIERPYDEGALMHIHVETDAGEAEVKYQIHRSLEPVAVVQAGDVPSGLKILFASLNLHFGNFGGIVVKLIYTLCGIGLCLLTYAGTRLWIYRVGRGKPRAAQCLDRPFDGIGLGLLPALAIFAWAIPAFCWLGVRLRRPDSQEMNVN